MACSQSTIAFLLEQTAAAGSIAARKMFGEYAIYRADKLVALVCDDNLYLKPTTGGRALLGATHVEAAPYPGAKPCLVVPVEAWDDAERMAALVRITAAELPAPASNRKAVMSATSPRRDRRAPGRR